MKRILFLIIAIVSVSISNAQDAKYKAMFISNFTKNIEWPASERTGDFIICVVNQNEVLGQLKTYTNGKSVGTQPISVVGVKSIDEVSKCHILYLSFADSKSEKIETAKSKLSGTSALIVSDRPGALKNGSCINFLLVDDKLKYELNKDALSERKLQVSAYLENNSYK
ncbi:MAG: YfiR family protein [Salinivirgaceae bacterium]|nr:YfiR family protein [Salinivirgaceae bacterium]MBR3568451.1 YfiR family protein [Salinivirgaceae bacterium]MBR4620250.1 YfiR family protein [Salinivirgaceae bacterium]